MPHRPERTGAATATASPAVSMYSQVNGLSGEAAARIMRPSSGAYSHPAGVVTPLTSTKPWVTAQSMGPCGMVPTLEKVKSSDSTDRSTSTKQDEERSVATLATEGSADDQEKREAIASALLLVSTAVVRHDIMNTSSSSTGGCASRVSSMATIPLKKRKKHLDFLRRNQDMEPDSDGKPDPCHVSPVSNSSASSSHVEGRTVSHEEVTPDRRRRLSATPQRSASYDSKESPYKQESTKELLNSSKIHNTTDIALPAQVVIPHFPSVLHQVLADSEYAGTVLAWLPDGEAWKVLRWDALRREVLPRYFSNLRDEDGSGCGTIDAFLWHLTTWGFQEIKDGTDVGAYKHELFIRGAQKLCSKMRFTAAAAPTDESPNTVSPARTRQGDHRFMLQVPTLSAVVRTDVDSSPRKSNKRARYEEQSSAISHSAVRRPSPLNWMGYRTEDPYADSHAWGHYYADPARMYPPQMYHDPRYQQQQQHRPQAPEHLAAQVSIHSPPQVRSGRGASRVGGSNRSAVTSSPVIMLSSRPTFPVSNRGKGRKTAACRIATKSPERLSPAPPVSFDDAQRIGSAVQGVAIAISRKTKRKLPLQRCTVKDEAKPACSDDEK